MAARHLKPRTAAIAITLAVATLLTAYAYIDTQPTLYPKIVQMNLRVNGLNRGVIAFVVPKDEQLGSSVPLQYARLNSVYLVKRGLEDVVVCGAGYTLDKAVAWREGGVNVLMLFFKPGSGCAYRISEFDGEVNAVIPENGVMKVIPLAKFVSPNRVLDIAGRAEACGNEVSLYIYPSTSDFNSSLGPDQKLFVASSPTINGEYRVRIDLESGPQGPRGMPLLTVFKCLLVYSSPRNGCYSWVFLNETKPGSLVRVDLCSASKG